MAWNHEETWTHAGLTCKVIRHPQFGNYNGYVQLPKTHPCHGKDYDDIPVDVHGGLTFASEGDDKYWPDKDSWWVGFDTLHAGDDAPGLMGFHGDHRWSLDEVKAETNRLAEQLANL